MHKKYFQRKKRKKEESIESTEGTEEELCNVVDICAGLTDTTTDLTNEQRESFKNTNQYSQKWSCGRLEKFTASTIGTCSNFMVWLGNKFPEVKYDSEAEKHSCDYLTLADSVVNYLQEQVGGLQHIQGYLQKLYKLSVDKNEGFKEYQSIHNLKNKLTPPPDSAMMSGVLAENVIREKRTDVNRFLVNRASELFQQLFDPAEPLQRVEVHDTGLWIHESNKVCASPDRIVVGVTAEGDNIFVPVEIKYTTKDIYGDNVFKQYENQSRAQILCTDGAFGIILLFQATASSKKSDIEKNAAECLFTSGYVKRVEEWEKSTVHNAQVTHALLRKVYPQIVSTLPQIARNFDEANKPLVETCTRRPHTKTSMFRNCYFRFSVKWWPGVDPGEIKYFLRKV